MKILGITNVKDAGIAFIDNKEVIFAANEERFSRKKLHTGFPYRAIDYLFKNYKLCYNDLDYIAYGWSKGIEISALNKINLRYKKAISSGDVKILNLINDRVRSEITNQVKGRNEFLRVLNDELNVNVPIKLFDHHKTHASCAFFTSPFKKALVVTMDGKGDFKSASIGIGEDNSYKEINCTSTLDSLGYYYGNITKKLGFITERHEGKVTGLAAYGDSDKCIHVMRKMIDFKDGEIVSCLGKYYSPWFTNDLPGLIELNQFSREEIAAACQKHIENIVCGFIDFYATEKGITDLCLAGGVFGNVKLNQKLLELKSIRNIYIHPGMGDGGLALGAALLQSSALKIKINRPLETVYLGPSYTNEDVKDVLSISEFKYKLLDKSQKIFKAVELIENNQVVGWFQGNLEYGPRALGNRSILYHPKDVSANQWLNKRLHRSEFMPFAPATIDKLAEKCFVGWEPYHLAAEFMTICYKCTELMKKKCPAVVHVDNTARPQVVVRDKNQIYYDLIEAYYERTKIPCIINTSFNDHEQPIVCSPIDALDSFRAGNIDYIFLEDYLVWK